MAASLNLVLGFLGQLSLGHCGFMAVGAYTAALISLAFQRAGFYTEKSGGVFMLVLVISIVAAGIVAALLGLLEKTVAEGCGRIATAQDAPEQLLVLRAAEGEAKTVAAALQKRLQSQQQAFAAVPAQGDKAAAGRVVAAGDYCLLFILDWPEEGSADAIEQDLLGYFVASA